MTASALPSIVAPVLVPVDFSPESSTTATFAARLAQEVDAPLVLLHVVHEGGCDCGYYRAQAPSEGPLLPLPAIAAHMAQSFLADLRRQEPELEPLLAAHTQVVTGLPKGRIVEVAERLGAAIIIMGRHTAQRKSGLFCRSLSDQIGRRTKIPVVAVTAPDDTHNRRRATVGERPERWREVAATYRAAFNV